MFTWNLALPKSRVPNAHQLALGAGLSYPVAVRVLANQPMARVDAMTLQKLADYFGVKNPLSLLRFTRTP